MGGGCSNPMTQSTIDSPSPNKVKTSSHSSSKNNSKIDISGEDEVSEKDIIKTRNIKENYIICKFNISQNGITRIINCGKNPDNLKNKCKLYVNNKEIEFVEKYNFNSIEENKLKIVCNSDFEDASTLFANCKNITEFDFSNFDSSKIINLESFFFQCSSLQKLDLSMFKCYNLKNMRAMFGNCSTLNEIILPGNTENVDDMSHLFMNCSSLEKIDFSNFITKNVTNMKEMFANCSKIKQLDLSSFNTENVRNMSKMFYKCVNLTEINLSTFNTNNVENMSGMFFNCISLEHLDLTKFNTNNVTDMSEMFSECLLKEINLYKLKNPKIKKMNLMFNKCEFLIQLDISNFKAYNDTDITDMFKGINTNCVLTNHNDKIINKFKEAVN